MPTGFVTVANAGDVKPGSLAAFDVGGVRVGVANVNGTFYAFDDACTHEQCSLSEGELEGKAVVCPCHAGQFDVTSGSVLEQPPKTPVKTYKVRVAQGQLQIEV